MIEWKVCPSNENYAISNTGDVKRITKAKGTFPGKLLKPRKDKYGYLFVALYMNRTCKDYKVHRLVLEAFVGPCPAGMECNHKKGIKTDNHLESIEYITRSGNHKHAFKTGLKNHQGENHPYSKLTEFDIIDIRKMSNNGMLQHEIAKIKNITKSNVGYIVNYKTWNHVV